MALPRSLMTVFKSSKSTLIVPGRMNDFRDADAGFVEHFVGGFKAFFHRGVRRAFFFELLVQNDDHRIDFALEIFNALFGRTHTASAFKTEGLRHHGHRENAQFLRNLSNHRAQRPFPYRRPCRP